MRCWWNLVVLALGVCALLGAAGCGDDDPMTPDENVSLEVSVTGLEELDAGKGHYEAWIGFPQPESDKRAPDAGAAPLHSDLEFISVGKFRVNSAGAIEALDGGTPEWNLRSDRNASFAAEAWISIEVEGDVDTIPGGLLLAGEFVGTDRRGTSSLRGGYRTIWDLQLADLNLATLAGSYTLSTPSDANANNEGQGLYWANGTLPGLTTMPVLDGVKITYEGWIEKIASGEVISMGRFTARDTLDSDGPGAGVSVTAATPNFPGQEFTAAAQETLNAGGYRVFITLEPALDNDPARPTQFELLSHTIVAAAQTGVATPATNVTAGYPTAFVVLNR
ncbi:MAG: hypothetical protein ACKVU1_18530 [bacterium]